MSFSSQSESADLHPPGSVGFTHTGCGGRGADGGGDDGEGAEGEGERREGGQERRGQLGHRRGHQGRVWHADGSRGGGGHPDRALIRVGGGAAAAPARRVSLCNRRGRGGG